MNAQNVVETENGEIVEMIRNVGVAVAALYILSW